MKQAQKGFTLIELMISVAIVGILAAVALPAYKDYMAKAQATEASLSTEGIRANLSLYYAVDGSFPTDALEEYAIEGKYGSATTIAGGVITYTFKAAGVSKDLQGKTVIYTGDGTGASVKFVCTTSIEKQAIRPKGCTKV